MNGIVRTSDLQLAPKYVVNPGPEPGEFLVEELEPGILPAYG